MDGCGREIGGERRVMLTMMTRRRRRRRRSIPHPKAHQDRRSRSRQEEPIKTGGADPAGLSRFGRFCVSRNVF
jgi:hypothetical protein